MKIVENISLLNFLFLSSPPYSGGAYSSVTTIARDDKRRNDHNA